MHSFKAHENEISFCIYATNGIIYLEKCKFYQIKKGYIKLAYHLNFIISKLKLNKHVFSAYYVELFVQNCYLNNIYNIYI